MEAAANPKYEDYEPSTEIIQEKDIDTILFHLPGFKKEKLRVQLTSSKMLRISGEKEIDNDKSIRFFKEFPVSSNYDANKITAKFEGDILYIRQPKLIIPEDKQDKKLPGHGTPTPVATPEKPADEPRQSQKPAEEPKPHKHVEQHPAENSSARDVSTKQANVQDVPQKKPEKGAEWRRSSSPERKFDKPKTGSLDNSEKRTGFPSHKHGTDATKEADKMDKRAAVAPAEKLKMSRRLMNVVLVVLLAVVLGMYITNFTSFFRTAEN